jgi:hypothetical protein
MASEDVCGRRTRQRFRVPLSVLVAALGALHPRPAAVPEPDERLVRALQFLDSDVDPTAVVAAGHVLGAVLSFPLALLASVLIALPFGLCFGAVSAVGVAVGTRRLPCWLATIRRTRALGAAPGLVARVALRIRVEPTTERAARFAAETGQGPLARSLGDHARRAAGTPRSGLGTFAATWRPWFPALDRAVALLEAGAAARPAERERSLDRALECVTDAARSRLAAFAGEVRGPASGTYAFGVVLPLALAGMLPAARAAGVPVDVRHVVVLYDAVLPLALLAASGWLLLRRPVAFPPPQVQRSHPDVASRVWVAPGAGVGCAILGWLSGTAVVAPWAGPVAAAGFGSGAGLLVYYRPIADVRDRVRAVEEGLDDALYLVGRRVAAGESVERAIEAAADELPGATGEVFADAVATGRQLRIGVRAAFLGEYGALETIPSQRARGAAALLAIAASEGRPAGAAIVSLADHLSELRRIERESRRELAAITGTLANTAALFGPLVGGATVALAGRMATAVESGGSVPATTPGSAAGASAIGTGELGLAVGGYVLATAAILTALAATLERGFDRALIGYRLGLALPAATATYLVTYAGVALVL